MINSMLHCSLQECLIQLSVSSEKAQKHREKGNAYFRKKSYLSATDSYTDCLRYAPRMTQEDTEDTRENIEALAYGNRSASLFHLKRHRMCLDDIAHALDCGYPEDLCYKLYDRRGKCFAEIGLRTEAVEAFNAAKDYMGRANLDEKSTARWAASLEKSLLAGADIRSNCYPIDDSHATKTALLKLTTERHPTYIAASQAIDVGYSDDTGRYMVAAQEIRTGDVLMVEEPYASVLFSDFYGSHCYRCMARVVAPVPCAQCSTVVFCGNDCRNAAWDKYHRYECRYQALLHKSWCGHIGHLAMRLVHVTGPAKLAAFLAERDGRDPPPALKAGLNKDGRYVNDHESVDSLTTNEKTRAPEGLFDFAVIAVFLTKILRDSGTLEDYGMSDNGESIGAIQGALLHHLQIIQCNGFCVTELQLTSDFENPHPAEIGNGIYPTCALMNHSCDACADTAFYGDAFVVRAVRPVRAGDEVTISYGPHFSSTKQRERQAALRSQYSFECRCVACRGKWPLWKEIITNVPTFICSECRKPLHMTNLKKGRYVTCRKCNHRVDVSECVRYLEASHESYAAAMADAVNGRVDEALPVLVRHLELMLGCLRQPWRDLVSCQEAVKQCYRLLANRRS